MTIDRRIAEVRTQIYLPEEWHRKLKELAQNRRVSFAALIREAIAQLVDEQDTGLERDKAWKRFRRLAGIGKRGPADVSVHSGKYFAQTIKAGKRV